MIRRVLTALALLLALPLAAAVSVQHFPLPKTFTGKPVVVAAGPDGNVWFIDSTTRVICRIDGTGTITDYPGVYAESLTAGADGGLWFTGGASLGRLDPYTGEVTPSVASLPGGGSYWPELTSGPDGNLWYVSGCRDSIARISLSGVVSSFPTTPGGCPMEMTTGPDGNIWFTEHYGNRVGRMTPGGALTEFSLAGISGYSEIYPDDITTGPDGNLWVTSNYGYLVRITPSGAMTAFPVGMSFGLITTGSDGYLWIATGKTLRRFNTSGESNVAVTLTGDAQINDLIQGPDGNLWAAAYGTSVVARITPALQVNEFSALTRGGDPIEVTTGPDGKVWFTEKLANKVGAITPGGDIFEYPITTPASEPAGITTASDGALWFVESAGDKVGRITTAGAITELPLQAGSGPTDITQGPDGNFWITLTRRDRIAMMTPAGAVTEYPLNAGSAPNRIITGSDGKLWFTLSTTQLGRIGTAGDIAYLGTFAPSGNYPLTDLTLAPDGSIWFADGFQLGHRTTAGNITRVDVYNGMDHMLVTPDGAVWLSGACCGSVTRYTPATGARYLPLQPGSGGPQGLALGSDGNLWVAQQFASRMSRIMISFDGEALDSCVTGPSFSGHLARFLDLSGTGVAGNYSASISWGDGSAPQAGTISIAGPWIYVDGAHTYGSPANRNVTVTITDLRETEDTLTVVAHLKPRLDATISISASCRNETITASVPDAGPGATYSWTIPYGTSINANGNQVSFILNVPETFISVTIRKDGYCDTTVDRLVGTTDCGRQPGDANADGKGDVLWRHDDGSNAIWLMNGFTKLQGSYLPFLAQPWVAAAHGDFDGDGRDDIFWFNPNTGQAKVWYMNGATREQESAMETSPAGWSVAGAGDFDRDGDSDILWRHSSGANALWLMSGRGFKSGFNLEFAPAVWSVAGVGDLNGDGRADIFWRRNDTGENAVWLMNSWHKTTGSFAELAPPNWRVAAVADLDRDGRADVIWRDPASGDNAVWRMDGATKLAGSMIEWVPPRWKFAAVRDLNGDGRADFFWRDPANGDNAVWMMNGFTKTAGSYVEWAPAGWSVIP